MSDDQCIVSHRFVEDCAESNVYLASSDDYFNQKNLKNMSVNQSVKKSEEILQWRPLQPILMNSCLGKF